MFDFFPFYFIMEWYGFCCWFLPILQKRKRKCLFNQGELDALEYHSKVSWKKYFLQVQTIWLWACGEWRAWLQTNSGFVACSTGAKKERERKVNLSNPYLNSCLQHKSSMYIHVKLYLRLQRAGSCTHKVTWTVIDNWTLCCDELNIRNWLIWDWQHNLFWRSAPQCFRMLCWSYATLWWPNVLQSILFCNWKEINPSLTFYIILLMNDWIGIQVCVLM